MAQARKVFSYSHRAENHRRANIGRALRLTESHAEHNHHNANPRPPADRAFLDKLATSLAMQLGLPLALAQARVAALVISAQPPPVGDGFKARSM